MVYNFPTSCSEREERGTSGGTLVLSRRRKSTLIQVAEQFSSEMERCITTNSSSKQENLTLVSIVVTLLMNCVLDLSCCWGWGRGACSHEHLSHVNSRNSILYRVLLLRKFSLIIFLCYHARTSCCYFV